MKSVSRISFFATLILSLLVQDIIGQTGAAFNYQAILRDSENQVISNRPVSLKLSLLEGSESGSAMYTETHQVTTGRLGQINLIVGNGSPVSGNLDNINWAGNIYYLEVWVDPDNGTDYKNIGASQVTLAPFAWKAGSVQMPVDHMVIKEPEGGVMDEALFEVKREDGSPVFAVYNEGVRVYVNEDQAKGIKGGFAVGGYSSGKGISDHEFFRVTPDSVRVYVRENPLKGIKGGFAVGGYSSNKGLTNYDFLRVSPDSVRIYVKEHTGKGIKGGFAVGGYSSGKAEPTPFMHLEPDNYFIGHEAGQSNTTGEFNSFFGFQSGYSNTEGSNNLFQGYQSGYFNDFGSNNIFLGRNSGFENSTGSENVFIGVESGHGNKTGVLNTFVGFQTGFEADSGDYNTLLGFWSGYSIAGGDLNTYLGAHAGHFAVDGDLNTVVGAYAGSEKNFGWHNTFIGMRAGSHNAGDRNTMLGSYAGRLNEEGQNNVFIGNSSGEYSSGNHNVYVGTNSGLNHSGDRSILIGYDAGAELKRSNTLIIDNGGGDSTMALIYGELDHRILRFNGAVGVNCHPEATFQVAGDIYAEGRLISDQPLQVKGIETPNSFGPTADYTSDGNYIAFGDPGVSEDFIGYKNNTFSFLDSPEGGDNLAPDVHVGGGLLVDGGVKFTGIVSGGGSFDLRMDDDGTLVADASDARLKRAFRSLENPLEKVLHMKAYSFQWKNSDNDKRDVGFVAQEVGEIFPEAVFTNPNDGMMGVNYSRITTVLVEAVKEQQKIIEEKERVIGELTERIEQIEAMLQIEH